MIRSGVLISMLVAGLGWAVAGAVAGPRRLPLSLAAGTALTVLASWIAVYGTYADTMGAAVIIGAPVGAIVGAAVGRVILKMRRGS